ncbi:serine hydrolase [Kitasatospora aburaviensis]
MVSLACWQRQRAVPEGQFLYSNTNYLLLAKLLETVHGMDLASLARRRLFDRLGMDATHFKSDPRQLIPCAASAYHLTSGGWQHSAEPVSLPGPGSSGPPRPTSIGGSATYTIAGSGPISSCPIRTSCRIKLPTMLRTYTGPACTGLQERATHRLPPWPRAGLLRGSPHGGYRHAGDLPFQQSRNRRPHRRDAHHQSPAESHREFGALTRPGLTNRFSETK